MGIRDAYTDWSATYDTDRNLTRDLDAAITRQIIAPQAGQTVLEIGCGTGKNTVWLAEWGEQVIALDFSEGMIARAKEKVTELGRENVTFAVADITQPLPIADGTANVATVNLVLEHISDLAGVFSRVARVLKDGGRFFVSELHPFRQYAGKKAVFQGEGGEIEIPAYIHHISEFLDAAQRAGFTLVRLDEWWHDEDRSADQKRDGLKPPRIVSFLFEKPAL